MQHVVLIVDRDEIDQHPVLRDERDAAVPGRDEAEDAEGDVQHAHEHRGHPRRALGRDQQQRADRQVNEVVPAVHREDVEHLVGTNRVAGVEARLVEEADDAGDHEDSAHQQAVEPCWA